MTTIDVSFPDGYDDGKLPDAASMRLHDLDGNPTTEPPAPPGTPAIPDIAEVQDAMRRKLDALDHKVGKNGETGTGSIEARVTVIESDTSTTVHQVNGQQGPNVSLGAADVGAALAAAPQAAVDTHVALPDPHTQYQKETEKDQPSGYASVDSGGKIPAALIPVVAISEVFAAANQSAMLALPAHTGDVAVRADAGISFILGGDGNPATLSNWIAMNAPGGVTSVQLGSGSPSLGAVVVPADGSAGTATLRTLGTAATQATAGNDARLSDARVPLSHAGSHGSGGSDPIVIDGSQISGAGTVADVLIAASIARDSEVTAAVLTETNRATAAEATKLAASDVSVTNARTPTAHHTSHDTGGSDPLAHVDASVIDTGVLGNSRVPTLDALRAPAADVSANTHKITNLVDPTGPQDAATRAYVLATRDALVNGAPGILDTLLEIDNQLASDESAASALATTVAGKQPVNTDLTTISGLVPTNNDLLQRKAGAWINRTPAQVKTDLAIATGDVSGLGTAATHPATDFDTAGAAASAQSASQPLAARLTALAGTTDTGSGAVVRATAPALSAPTGIVKGDVGLGNVDNVADVSKPVSTAQAASIATRAQALTRVTASPFTANHTLVAGELASFDTSSGALTATLPTAPTEPRAVCGVKCVAGPSAVTVACGGSDVINRTGGVTSTTITRGGSLFLQYDSTTSIWTIVANDLGARALVAARRTMSGANLTGLVSDRTVVGGTFAATITYTLPSLDQTVTSPVPDGWEIEIGDDTGSTSASVQLAVAPASGDTIVNGVVFGTVLIGSAYGIVRVKADVAARKWRWDGMVAANANPTVDTSDSVKAGFTTTGLDTQLDVSRLMAISVNGTPQTADFTVLPYTGYTVNTAGGAIAATLPSAPSLNATVLIRNYASSGAGSPVTLTRGGTDVFNVQASPTTFAIQPNTTALLLYRSGIWFPLIGWDTAALDARYPALTLTSLATNDLIQWNGSAWVNHTPAAVQATLAAPRIATFNQPGPSNTLTPNVDTTDLITVLAATAGFSVANPTGTPADGQRLVLRFKDNGTARAITWSGTQYRASSDDPFPTTTVLSKTLYLAFMYNAADTKWDLVGQRGNF